MPAGDVSLGLIGLGGWGRNIARTVAAVPGVRLAAAASGNPQAPRLVPTDCRIYADWRELVAAGDLQGVLIASPPATHGQMLLAAVESGKAVFVEKPLVASQSEAQQLLDRIGGKPVIALVDHIHLFHPAFQKLRQVAPALGSLRSIAASAGKADGARRDVSLIWDWAPHDIAMCMALAAGPVGVSGARCIEIEQGSDPRRQTVAFSLTLGTDALAHVELSTIKPRHRWFAATFDGGVLVYRDAGAGSLVQLGRDEDVQAQGIPVPFAPKPPLQVAIARFADAIRRGDHDGSSLEMGFSVVNLVADIEYRLAQTSP